MKSAIVKDAINVREECVQTGVHASIDFAEYIVQADWIDDLRLVFRFGPIGQIGQHIKLGKPINTQLNNNGIKYFNWPNAKFTVKKIVKTLTATFFNISSFTCFRLSKTDCLKSMKIINGVLSIIIISINEILIRLVATYFPTNNFSDRSKDKHTEQINTFSAFMQ